MSLEQDQGTEAEAPETPLVEAEGTEAPAESTSGETSGEAGEVPEVPEWQKALDEQKKAYDAQIEKMQKGMDKSIGKMRTSYRDQVEALKARFDSIMPEPKREQYESDAAFNAAKKVIDPIRQDWSKQDADLQKQTESEQQAEIQAQFVEGYKRQLSAHPKAEDVNAKYVNAISVNPELDLDNDMIAFVGMSSKGVDVVDKLYDNPSMIPQLKAMPQAAKVAYLSDLAMSQPQVSNPAPVPPKAQVAPPAKPPKGGSGGVSDINNLVGDDYLTADRKNRGK